MERDLFEQDEFCVGSCWPYSWSLYMDPDGEQYIKLDPVWETSKNPDKIYLFRKKPAKAFKMTCPVGCGFEVPATEPMSKMEDHMIEKHPNVPGYF